MQFPINGVCDCGCRAYGRDGTSYVTCLGCYEKYDLRSVPQFNEDKDKIFEIEHAQATP